MNQKFIAILGNSLTKQETKNVRLTRLNKKISSYPKKQFHQKTKSTSKSRFQEGHVECRMDLEGVQKFKMDNRGLDDLLDLEWSSESLFKRARVHLNGQGG